MEEEYAHLSHIKEPECIRSTKFIGGTKGLLQAFIMQMFLNVRLAIVSLS